MPFSFANPLGFWALLGIPAIILIHFLQQKSTTIHISTLFLLKHLQHESIKGKQFDRLRPSIPLWLQLLAVILLSWILVQPRWMKGNAVQRIAIVLDSSASMECFRDNLYSELDSELHRLASKVRHTEYIVVDSQLYKQPLFNGTNPAKLIEALENWKPLASFHDFTPALRVARSLVGAEGSLIMVSDHLIEDLPYDAQLLAIGQATDNVGFAGMRVITKDDGQILWKVTIRNYSGQKQKRSLFLHSGSKKSSVQNLNLAPGQTRSLQGAFPGDSDSFTLRLDQDAFALDDQMPIVRPKKKQVTLSPKLSPDIQALLKPVLKSLEHTSSPAPEKNADLFFSAYKPLQPAPLEKGHGIVFLTPNPLPAKYLKGSIYTEHHPLLDDLNWQSLLAQSSVGLPLLDTDTPLLWQNERALIFLRSDEQGTKLVFNFDLATSNAAHLPAFIIMIHRFVDSVRQEKIAASQLNFEISQPIDLAFDRSADAPPLTLSDTVNGKTHQQNIRPGTTQLRAPAQPGFFKIHQADADAPLLSGATHFADTREADLQLAASRNDLSKSDTDLIDQYTEQDAQWQVWILALCLCLLVSWHFVTRPASNPISHF